MVRISYESEIQAIELLKILELCQTLTANCPLIGDKILLQRIWIEVFYTVKDAMKNDLVGEVSNPDNEDDISKYRQVSMHMLTTIELKTGLKLSLFDVKEYCKNQASISKNH